MGLNVEQIENISALLKSSLTNDVLEGTTLFEQGNATSADLRSIFPNIQTTWMPKDIKQHLDTLNYTHSSYLTVWFLGTMAQWDLSISERIRNVKIESWRELPQCLQNLSHLEHLDCSHIYRLDWPNTLTEFPNLTSLNLSFCSEVAVNNVPLGHLTTLQSLDLTGCGLRKVPDWITTLTQLQHLSLGGRLWGWDHGNTNNLTELPETISQLTQLQTLDLSLNNLSSLPQGFSALNELTTLNLTHNIISQIPEVLATLTNLQSLDLSNDLDPMYAQNETTNTVTDSEQERLRCLLPNCRILF